MHLWLIALPWDLKQLKFLPSAQGSKNWSLASLIVETSHKKCCKCHWLKVCKPFFMLEIYQPSRWHWKKVGFPSFSVITQINHFLAHANNKLLCWNGWKKIAFNQPLISEKSWLPFPQPKDPKHWSFASLIDDKSQKMLQVSLAESVRNYFFQVVNAP